MKNLRNLFLGMLTLTLVISATTAAMAGNLKAKTVVLVHGAFADGSSWSRVIPLLKKAGLNVIAVQNPLVSLEGDVAFTKRAIERAEGPVVLVGHSWGGMVITEAGAHNKVQSLVYVAAMAPSKGESLMDASNGHPAPKGAMMIQSDAQGYLTMTAENMKLFFAQDLSKTEVETMAAVQGAWNSAALGQKTSVEAWAKKPSWYAISTKDEMIHPDAQKAYAKKIKAKTITLDASHASMLSKPKAIADLIIKAAK